LEQYDVHFNEKKGKETSLREILNFETKMSRALQQDAVGILQKKNFVFLC